MINSLRIAKEAVEGIITLINAVSAYSILAQADRSLRLIAAEGIPISVGDTLLLYDLYKEWEEKASRIDDSSYDLNLREKLQNALTDVQQAKRLLCQWTTP